MCVTGGGRVRELSAYSLECTEHGGAPARAALRHAGSFVFVCVCVCVCVCVESLWCALHTRSASLCVVLSLLHAVFLCNPPPPETSHTHTHTHTHTNTCTHYTHTRTH